MPGQWRCRTSRSGGAHSLSRATHNGIVTSAESGDDREEVRPPTVGSGLLREHLGIAVAGVALATVLLKLVSVSHGNLSTAGAILESQGSGELVLAALLAGMGGLVFVAMVWSIPHFGEALREGDDLQVPIANLIVTIVMLLAFVPYERLYFVGLYLTFWTVSSLVWVWRKGKSEHARGRESVILVGAMTVVITWLVVAGSGRLWLPAEVFTLAGGEEVVGYALSDSDGSVVVVREDDRSLIRLDLDELSSRSYCRVDSEDPRTMLNVVLGQEQPDTRLCPA